MRYRLKYSTILVFCFIARLTYQDTEAIEAMVIQKTESHRTVRSSATLRQTVPVTMEVAT